MDSNKLKSFEHLELVYKQVNGHNVETSVLMPKKVTTGILPALVHFHGGGLVMGDKLYLPWWASWLIQLAEKHSAIIVSPNYRLIPESTVSDTLQDLMSFWAWIRESLAFEVKKIHCNISPNTGRITVVGESAGGFLSIQSALLHQHSGICAVISQYGTMLFDHPFFTQPSQGDPENRPVPRSIVDNYIASIQPGTVRTSSVGDSPLILSQAFTEHGKFRDFLGHDERVYLNKALQQEGGIPPIWLIQGLEDTAMPLECSQQFVQDMKALHPETLFHYSLKSGGLGSDLKSTLADDWVRKGVDFIERFWP